MTKEFVLEKMGAQLDLIKSEDIKNLTIKALMKVKKPFYEVAASSTGKYHPDYAQGEGGLLRHVQAAVYFADTLTQLEMFEVDDITRDLIISAVILHDTCKGGVEWNRSYAFEHPLLVKQLLSEEELDGVEALYWEEITEMISSHMGQWTTSKRSSYTLPKPETKEQKIVHLCDFLASRKEVEVNIFGDDFMVSGKACEESSRREALKFKPASEQQKKFVAVLIRKARTIPGYNPKFNDVEVEDLTWGAANVLIGELREIVGD